VSETLSRCYFFFLSFLFFSFFLLLCHMQMQMAGKSKVRCGKVRYLLAGGIVSLLGLIEVQ